MASVPGNSGTGVRRWPGSNIQSTIDLYIEADPHCGKKKVYLARDSTLDREVAFAPFKIDGLDETFRSPIQREAKAKGGMGSYPL